MQLEATAAQLALLSTGSPQATPKGKGRRASGEEVAVSGSVDEGSVPLPPHSSPAVVAQRSSLRASGASLGGSTGPGRGPGRASDNMSVASAASAGTASSYHTAGGMSMGTAASRQSRNSLKGKPPRDPSKPLRAAPPPAGSAPPSLDMFVTCKTCGAKVKQTVEAIEAHSCG